MRTKVAEQAEAELIRLNAHLRVIAEQVEYAMACSLQMLQEGEPGPSRNIERDIEHVCARLEGIATQLKGIEDIMCRISVNTPPPSAYGDGMRPGLPLQLS